VTVIPWRILRSTARCDKNSNGSVVLYADPALSLKNTKYRFTCAHPVDERIISNAVILFLLHAMGL
jgi:hypothetical protein